LLDPDEVDILNALAKAAATSHRQVRIKTLAQQNAVTRTRIVELERRWPSYEHLSRGTPEGQPMGHDLKFFVGAWELLEATFTALDGSTYLPWGEAPVGTLLVLESGDSSAQLMRRDRTPFASALPTPAEKQQVYDEYFSYFGRMRANEAEHTIVNKVEGASNPNWIGSEQLRHVEVEDPDHIVLITPPLPIAGRQLVGRLRWQRRS
jgi:hypothetical protein